MPRIAIAAIAVLLCSACAPRPAWVEQGPAADPAVLATVVAGPAAAAPRLREQALAELAARLAPEPPAAASAPAADDRYGRLRAALAASAALPEPPRPAVRDTLLDGDRAWVLAEVRIDAWTDRLRRRCAEIDRALAAAVAALPAEADAVDAVRCLRAAAPAQAERAALAAALARIDPALVPALPAELEPVALERRLRALLERATIELVALDAGTQPIVAAVGDSLERSGWRVVNRDGWARLAVTVATSERTIDGVMRIDGVLDGELTVAGGGGGQVHLSDRGDGGDLLLVHERLGLRLGERLAGELDRRLLKAADLR